MRSGYLNTTNTSVGGETRNSGTIGYYWGRTARKFTSAGSTGGAEVYRLDIYRDKVDSLANSARLAGFPLRCLSTASEG